MHAPLLAGCEERPPRAPRAPCDGSPFCRALRGSRPSLSRPYPRPTGSAAEPAAHPAAAVQDTQRVAVTRNGARPSQRGPSETFTGTGRIDLLFDPNDASRAGSAYVTFEPGARTAWHTHPRGQRLVVTAGVGRVQGWGGPSNEIRPGDVVWIPVGVKHWHGAAPATAMTHIAIQEARDGTVVTWLEHVSDDQYMAGASQR